MRTAKILVVLAALGLAAPFAAQAMPLSDPPGDVKRADVDILGGEIVLGGGNTTLRLKLAGGLHDRDVYTLRIFGQGGERWTLRASRKDGKSSFSARDEGRHKSYRARGQLINRLVAISFSSSRMGASKGHFRFSISAASPKSPPVLDTLPANGRPRGTASIPFVAR
jgi:hypothetical protein